MYVTCQSSLTKKCDGQKDGWTDQTDGQTDKWEVIPKSQPAY